MCLKCGKLINCDYKKEEVMNITPYEATVFALEFLAQGMRDQPQATKKILTSMDVSDEYAAAIIIRLDIMTARGKLRWQ